MDRERSTHDIHEKFIQNFLFKARRKRRLRTLRCGWKENITLELKEIEYNFLNQIRLIQDRGHCRDHDNTVVNFRFL